MVALLAALLLSAQAWAGLDARAIIRAEIMRSLPWDASSVEIDEIEAPGIEASGYSSVKVELPRSVTAAGKLSFALEVRAPGQQPRTLWGSARVRVYRDAVVTLKPLKGRARLAEGDLRVARVELDEATDAFSTTAEAAGMVAQRPMAAGSVVKRAFVRPELVVRRGERVGLRVHGPSISIRSRGVAAEDGHIGAAISVKTASGKEVLGTVSGPGEVTIEF